MDQEKIGRFIAEKRKEQKLTQGQLAERLGVSTNAVSKWERGLCLMDMSLLKPLSEILKVSVNELLAGEEIREEYLAQKSEENITALSELVHLRSMKYGVFGMGAYAVVLLLISSLKGEPPTALVSLLCAYNAVTFLSRYKIAKDRSDCIAGVLFAMAALCHTIALIAFP